MGLLDGQTAIVTGAASGIGEASAKRFTEEGATVVVADIDDDSGQQVVDEVREMDGESKFLHVDTSDEGDVQGMIETTVSEFGDLDIVFNNAGIEGPQDTIADFDSQGFEDVVNVNLKGVMWGTKHGIRNLRNTGGGSIINTASILSFRGLPENGGYAATKGGVAQITKTAAIENAAENVRVNGIAPGVVETDMLRRALDEVSEPEEVFNELEPMPGLTQPEDVADAAVLLASDLTGRTTGHIFPVDGGFLAQ
jgi:NAD(P)-dependent dehydrogenase (short-subunit alcohol dehydrogenase family)